MPKLTTAPLLALLVAQAATGSSPSTKPEKAQPLLPPFAVLKKGDFVVDCYSRASGQKLSNQAKVPGFIFLLKEKKTGRTVEVYGDPSTKLLVNDEVVNEISYHFRPIRNAYKVYCTADDPMRPETASFTHPSVLKPGLWEFIEPIKASLSK